jgi:hypothetical protein
MKQLVTEIEINASPERVWQILSDTARFPEWNPFIRKMDGELAAGKAITVLLQPVGGNAMTIRPTVLQVKPNRELRWIGHLFFPGIFDGEHIFEIEPVEENRVRFIQREQFNGILITFFNFDGTRGGFEAMNAALKARAESAG